MPAEIKAAGDALARAVCGEWTPGCMEWAAAERWERLTGPVSAPEGFDPQRWAENTAAARRWASGREPG